MKNKVIKIVLSIILFVIAIIIPFPNELINNCIFALSYIIVGYEIIRKATRNIFRGKVFDENFLMTVATIGAFVIGEFPEATMVMVFYQIGEVFQNYAVNKSRKSIASLMEIKPDFANVIREDNEEKVNPEEVKIGEIIVVKPGEKVALDGIVIEGDSMLDTIALTGESVPRKANIGNEILSGCINLNGLLKIQVTKQYIDSTVSKILDLVENASSRKSKSENFISKFAKYYTPIVVMIAVILAIIPPILTEETFSDWIYRALSFLVVSCPCALVISVPLSFFGGIGGAAKLGILIKGSNYLEALANTEIVVLDKTGTLTEGVFEVQKIHTEINENEFIKIAAHAEHYSNHPIADSIKKYYGKEIDEEIIEGAEELSGLGLSVNIEGKNILIGNEKLMIQNNIEYIKCEEVGTVVYMSIDKKFAGYILISDKIKDDSEIAIKELRKNNVKQIIMLTGDRKNVGEDVAKKLKLDRVYTELLPADKVEKVEELLKEKTEKGKVVFCGDGLNDAPVLALADLGIAMGGLGADAAIEASDIVIMTDELLKIVKAIKLAKKNMRIVRQNIVFAIGVKILVLILSVIGSATMWEAVFADVGVSIIAIINSLRMLSVKKV
ncbi:MAG: cadmium-translocating P-type ATPase [Clostridiales bacterium]|nr:cadmium-translocating P-type ATPase [Clostridiales bacterium]